LQKVGIYVWEKHRFQLIRVSRTSTSNHHVKILSAAANDALELGQTEKNTQLASSAKIKGQSQTPTA